MALTELALLSTLACETNSVLSVSQPESVIAIETNTRALVKEQGHELEYWNGQRWVALAMPTVRFGAHQFESGHRQLRLRPTHAQTAVARVSVKCDIDLSAQQRWHRAAQALAERTEVTPAMPADVSLANTLIGSAPDAHTRAYGEHLYAVTLMRAGRWLDAESHIAKAAAHWAELGEAALESSAWLAAASFSERRSAFEQTERFAAQSKMTATRARQPYIVLRARAFDCRAIRRANRQTEYLRCVADLIRDFRALGETLDEVDFTIDWSLAMRESGQRVSALPMLSRVGDLPLTPDAFPVRGRAFLAAGYLASDIGDLPGALMHFQSALNEFSRTLKDGQRWQVNTLIQIANLQAGLGLNEQAIKQLNHAVSLVDAKEAPARIAAVFSAYGNVVAQSHSAEQASAWYKQAQSIQTSLKMSLDANTSQLLGLQASFGQMTAHAMLEELTKLEPLPANYRTRHAILSARLQATLNKQLEAQRLLTRIDRAQLSADDGNLLALAEAELAGKSLPLSLRLNQLSQTADQSPTAALAYLTLRSGEKVRRAWVDALEPTSNTAEVFRAALLATPARFMTSVRSAQKRVDPVAKQAEGEQGFVAQLTGPQEIPPERFRASQVPSLAQFQARLPTDGLALVLMPGDRQSVALWIGRDFSKLALLPARATLQAAAVDLSALLASPQSAPRAVAQAANKLAAMLFKDAPKASPESLWIVADELSAAIPFSSLAWPGQTEPLVAGTDLSLVTGLLVDPSFSAPTNKQAGTSAPLPSFFAPDYRALSGALAGAAPRLSSLDFANVEHALIERESRRTWPALTGKQATRSTFQDLIQTPGAWLHVAAHGKANPGLLGNAGLWLASADGPDADLLSWLELGNVRTQAELMVLNACQSATGAQPSRQANVSFALAMSTSGAQHVVAALWPVSDVASGTWIPAFYRNLAQSSQAEASSAALRQAQLTLYRSPHYRHPFYWASLVHFRRVVF